MQTLRRIIYTCVIVLSIILLWREEIMLPVTTTLVIIFILTDFFIERNNIKTDRSLAIKGKSNRLETIFSFVPGFIMIVWGLLDKRLTVAFHGIDSKVFLGVIFFAIALSRNNYLIHITDKTISFKDSWGQTNWKINSIDKVIIHAEKIEFHKNSEKREFSFLTNNTEAIQQIEKFLFPRIKEKIIKE